MAVHTVHWTGFLLLFHCLGIHSVTPIFRRKYQNLVFVGVHVWCKITWYGRLIYGLHVRKWNRKFLEQFDEPAVTVTWTTPHCHMNHPTLSREPVHPPIWTIPHCHVNHPTLPHELVHTVTWTTLNCPMNYPTLSHEQVHTATYNQSLLITKLVPESYYSEVSTIILTDT
jgi:hypothetical protein